VQEQNPHGECDEPHPLPIGSFVHDAGQHTFCVELNPKSGPLPLPQTVCAVQSALLAHSLGIPEHVGAAGSMRHTADQHTDVPGE
jgi:hypothetical protein